MILLQRRIKVTRKPEMFGSHLSGSTGVIDTFLNGPPPGFKKNAFQFTLGSGYAPQ